MTVEAPIFCFKPDSSTLRETLGKEDSTEGALLHGQDIYLRQVKDKFSSILYLPFSLETTWERGSQC